MKIKLSIISLLLIITVFIYSNSQKEGMNNLLLENIEALGSPESGGGFKYCTQAGGYCFENGISVRGISMKDE